MAGMIEKCLPNSEESSKPELATTSSAVPMTAITEPRFPVVGIGASAGGLDAFRKFLGSMPANSGMAFVLIPHLDPTRDSVMVELLARATTMPVVEAKEDMPVEPDCVYILPPNKYMTISGGRLHLTGPVERGGMQTSIDLFLRSLAEDRQELAIGIVLTGTGSHGTLGLKAIKANGGMAMVQDPKTAEFDSMPLSSIATGQADYILPPEQMPQALLLYVEHFSTANDQAAEAVEATYLDQVLALLRTRAELDFRCYRKKTLLRRAKRRMGLLHIDQIPKYLVFLREHPEEVKSLAKDLLISVTSFFRDREVFQTLETQVIPQIVRTKQANHPLRVWVPGCATGEEAYSIAMLLLEQMASDHKTCTLQVFATDVAEEALKVARKGCYPESITADVSAARLARFFILTEGHVYQVSKELREAVTFAAQNVLGDPPFSKVDLISCRNLLIYLEPDIQQKLLGLFHFALREPGYLLLGHSETVGYQDDLFGQVSRKSRLYRRLGPSGLERVDYFPILAGGEKAEGIRNLTDPVGMPSSGSSPQELESELTMTRSELRNTIGKLEGSNEDLKASNEEIMSMNEEFQATNEELETSKEEMQSLNEELSKVNSQLQEKVGGACGPPPCISAGSRPCSSTPTMPSPVHDLEGRITAWNRRRHAHVRPTPRTEALQNERRATPPRAAHARMRDGLLERLRRGERVDSSGNHDAWPKTAGSSMFGSRQRPLKDLMHGQIHRRWR